jgi:hypothetical protein
MSILTYKYRIKDSTSGTRLLKMASAINYVWNYCQDIGKYLSGLRKLDSVILFQVGFKT